jgi:NADH-quinone oxidoreductase subunit M
MNLSRVMPFAAFAFIIASAASMGIPGFSGFAAEITILIGAWKTFPWAVWITGVGMVLVAAFTLRALKKSFFSDNDRAVRTEQGRVPVDSDWNQQAEISDRITLAEKLGASLLMFTTLAVGLYPKLLLDRIMPAVEAMRFLKPGG